MESHSTRNRSSKSISALIFLTLIGVSFLFISLVAIACGFVINFLDDFDATHAGQELEAKIQAEFDYSQYWLGFPFLLTAILSLALATCQHKRSLTTTTLVFFVMCIVLALFAMVLEGVDWIFWKNMDRKQSLWDNKDDYKCTDTDGAKECVCMNTNSKKNITISKIASCSVIATLSGMYGGIVGPAITGIFLSLGGIVVILKSLSWKSRSRHQYVEYDLQTVNPVQYHHNSYGEKDGFYGNGEVAMNQLPSTTEIKSNPIYSTGN